MNRIIKASGRLAAAALALALGLTACAVPGGGQAQSGSDTSPYTPAQMAEVVLATQPSLPQMYLLPAVSNDFADRLQDGYLIDPSNLSDGAICCPLGYEAAEITILRMKSAQAAQKAADALRAYKQTREDTFVGYAPTQADLAARGVVAIKGRTVALLICAEDGAEDAFLACFGPAPTPLPDTQRLLPHTAMPQPDKPDNSGGQSGASASVAGGGAQPGPRKDVYDHDAVLKAYQSGDESALGDKNRAVLQMCREVIETQLTDGMSVYEQELAVHDWMIEHANYDTAVYSNDPRAKIEPDNDNPYGLLVGKKGICMGYASTFQLFMDMLGIECVTVQGEANRAREEHAWNQVRLGGEWYCVDVTWDDPSGGTTMKHRYFNVTSQFMRETHHYWDETGVPECTATQYRWQG